VSPDWKSEGLLEGLDDDEAREARADLLDQLDEAGVEVDELRRAIDEDRLALLPAEQIFRGGASELTPGDVAEQAGVSTDLLNAHWQALGLPRPDPDAKAFGERDVEQAKQLKQFMDAGLPEEGVIGVARVIGEGMARVSETIRDLAGSALLQAGDNERDLGLRYAAAARELSPMVGQTLSYVYDMHMREGIRSDVVGASERASGRLPGSTEIAVCFADLVDFTKLGEHLPPEEIGGVAGELADMASDVAESPVKLVKTIGDAAMLVSSEPEALIKAALGLVARADEAREGFPQLRAGVACGPALGRGGDWYGRPVNVASRVTGVARPGSVLVTEGAREGLKDAFRWSFAGRRKLKGVKGEVPLYRARLLGSGDDES
jgi:adenylate cyclase